MCEGLNSEPVGQPTISDDTPAVNQLLTVSAAGVTDADNPGGITGAFYVWQVERDPVGAPGVFEDIVDETSGNPTTVSGTTFRVTADLDGLALRVKVIYQDAQRRAGDGVLRRYRAGRSRRRSAGGHRLRPRRSSTAPATACTSSGPTSNSFSIRS